MSDSGRGGDWRYYEKMKAMRDFPDDAKNENGNYQNKCLLCDEVFVGNKGRVTCRLCEKKQTVWLQEEAEIEYGKSHPPIPPNQDLIAADKDGCYLRLRNGECVSRYPEDRKFIAAVACSLWLKEAGRVRLPGKPLTTNATVALSMCEEWETWGENHERKHASSPTELSVLYCK